MDETSEVRKILDGMTPAPLDQPDGRAVVTRNRIRLLDGLLARLDTGLAGALLGCAELAEAQAVFDALLDGLPGTLAEKWVKMGSPLLLAFRCGLRPRELDGREYAAAMAELEHGPRAVAAAAPDGRSRPVRAKDTGETWSSVRDAARAIGCAVGTLHNHLNGTSQQATVYGRVFEYGEKVTSPYALDLTTPEKLEAYRAQCRIAGFEPTV